MRQEKNNDTTTMEEKTMTQPLSNLFKVMFQFPRAPPGSQARKTSPRVDDPALRWLRQLWDFMQKLGYLLPQHHQPSFLCMYSI